MRLLICLLFLFACKKADFLSEKQEFYNAAIAHGCVVLPLEQIYFAELEDGIAGYCLRPGIILLNSKRWDKFGPYQKREVVFHELGHCVLHQEHTALGIMSDSMHSEDELELMWDKYVALMFSNCVTIGDLLKVKQ